MSDSNWGRYGSIGLVAAIFALLFLAVSYGKEREQDAERRYASTADGSYPVEQFATPRSGVPAIAETFVSNPEPEDGSDREKRDLAAQESMAVWAFWMAVAAIGTMVITSLGTVLIWRQVSLTREAVEDTGKATEAMVEANRIAEQAQRPWVIVSSPSWTDKGLRIYFKNIGKLPAVNFCKTAEAMAMPSTFLASTLPELDDLNSTTLYPDQVEILTVETPEDLKPGYEWVVRIRASYELPNGEMESLYEAVAFNRERQARKVTARDFVGKETP